MYWKLIFYRENRDTGLLLNNIGRANVAGVTFGSAEDI
jgi:hypothetical protein